MHDNPDPDAIASGWAILTLIEEKLPRPARLVAGGAIVRAENRHMVELLSPPLELINSLDVDDATATILVDCGLNNTHQMLTRQQIPPVAVIDHHQTFDGHKRSPFSDVRPDMVASATITASYLREQDVEPGVKLSTALLYAIRTETCGSAMQHTRLDRSIINWLTGFSDPQLLAEIENAPLSRAYFGDLTLALQNTFLYDDAALCLLPRAEGAEVVGEVADLLIRCDGIDRVLCGAIINNDLLVSVRTVRDGADATHLLRKTLEGFGSGGGHEHRAGGKVCDVGGNGRISETLEDEIRGRWIRTCDIDRERGIRLVTLHDIVDNL